MAEPLELEEAVKFWPLAVNGVASKASARATKRTGLDFTCVLFDEVKLSGFVFGGLRVVFE